MKAVKCCQLSQKFSFISMITLTATFFVVEIVVGYVTNSMALVADSFHMLSDVVSLLVGYIALRYSRVGQQTGRYTFGWARAEVLGALVNAVFLVALCFSILVEALKRVILPEHLDNPKLVLITGGIGLFVNIIGLFLFHQHGHSHSHGGSSHGHSHGGGGGSHGHNNTKSPPKKHIEANEKANHPAVIENSKEIEIVDRTATAIPLLQQNDFEIETHIPNAQTKDLLEKEETVEVSASQLNIRGVYLHVLGDALGSVIVMISALIVIFEKGDWTRYVDPTMSIIMVLIILKTSIPLLKESSMILMQTVPTHIKIQEIQDRLVERIPGVLSVHEFHIWQLAGNKIIASAHVRCKTLPDYMAIANQLKEFFHNEGIHSTTIQPEFVEPPPNQPDHFDDINDKIIDNCLIECMEECSERTCCGNSTSQVSSIKNGNGNASSGDSTPKLSIKDTTNLPV